MAGGVPFNPPELEDDEEDEARDPATEEKLRKADQRMFFTALQMVTPKKPNGQ